MTTNPIVTRIALALASRTPRLAERDEPFHEAAVALVLRPRADDDCDLLLIRRAVRDDDPWSGQIALPGGRLSASDESLEAAALRETVEEVGLDLRVGGSVLGALDEMRPRTPVLPPIIVRPYVCVIGDVPSLVLNHEVAEVRWVRLGEIFAPTARVSTEVTVRGQSMRVQAYKLGDMTVWGMTERFLSGLQELLT